MVKENHNKKMKKNKIKRAEIIFDSNESEINNKKRQKEIKWVSSLLGIVIFIISLTCILFFSPVLGIIIGIIAFIVAFFSFISGMFKTGFFAIIIGIIFTFLSKFIFKILFNNFLTISMLIIILILIGFLILLISANDFKFIKFKR